jgi:hypothetical protein
MTVNCAANNASLPWPALSCCLRDEESATEMRAVSNDIRRGIVHSSRSQSAKLCSASHFSLSVCPKMLSVGGRARHAQPSKVNIGSES